MGLDRRNSDFHFLIECVGNRAAPWPASEIASESATAAQAFLLGFQRVPWLQLLGAIHLNNADHPLHVR